MKKYTKKDFRQFTFYGYKNFLRSLRYKVKKVIKDKKLNKRIVIELPQKLNIQIPKYRDKIIHALHDIRSNLILGKDVIISFKKVVAPVMPDAMILLISERKRLLQEFKERRIYCQKHKNNERVDFDIVNQLLEKFSLITRSGSIKEEHSLVKDWCYEEGIDDTYGDSQRNLVDSIVSKFKNMVLYPPIQVEDFSNPQPLEKRLTINLTEATANATEHAYLRPRFKDEKKLEAGDTRWWMFKSSGSYPEDANNDGMGVVVCDRGIGIPRSLHIMLDDDPSFFSPSFREKFKRIISLKNDAWLIEAAIEHGRSRTRKDERGKGLYQIADTIEKTPNSMLLIHSGKGLFHISVDSNLKITKTHKLYDNSIMGTIIYWYLPVKGDNPNE